MMRNILPLFALLIGLSSAAEIRASCSGCAIGKEKLQCDYYVAQRGDTSRREQCRIYAEYVDIDGAYPKAAWYYLLAGDVKKALNAAQKGLEQGQEYGREYLAIALWISGKKEEAKRELATFRQRVAEHGYLGRDLKQVARLYPESGLEGLR